MHSTRRSSILLSTTTLLVALAGCGDDGSSASNGSSSTSGTATTTSTGGTATGTGGGTATGAGGAWGTGGSGAEGGAGGASVCTPGSTESCYSGPSGTEGVGLCVAGQRTCTDDGSGFGPCVGEVLPAVETCATLDDDDCDGQVNEEGDGCVCVPGTLAPCYSGPPGTGGVGACRVGSQECAADGRGYGACEGEILPTLESCTSLGDEDCDGQTNEEGDGCVCVPGSTAPCYSGPPGTQGVGACAAGTQTCNAAGTAYGACAGEVTPVAESCGTAADDDCDGTANEGCPASVSFATDVRPILQTYCAPCHTSGGSGGYTVTSYASTQAASYYCGGRTKGACSLVRVQDGSMPAGRGCTGNPTTDAGNALCLTAAAQATISAWIAGGQQP